MARKFEISLIISAKDQATQKMKNLSSWAKDNASQFKAVGIAFVAAGAAVIAGSIKAVQAYAEEEKAVNDLTSALKSYGDNSDELVPRFKTLASAIQKTTIYGDELVLSIMAQIRNLGVMPAQMELATKGSIGLAKALNMDAQSAARYTALALQGETTILGRYIPALRQATTTAEKQAIVVDFMRRGYEQATKETDTFSGRIKQLQNVWGDLLERVGVIILPIFSALAKVFQDELLPVLDNYISNIEKSGSSTEKTIFVFQNLRKFLYGIIGAFQIVGSTIATLIFDIVEDIKILEKLFKGVTSFLNLDFKEGINVFKSIKENINNINTAQDKWLETIIKSGNQISNVGKKSADANKKIADSTDWTLPKMKEAAANAAAVTKNAEEEALKRLNIEIELNRKTLLDKRTMLEAMLANVEQGTLRHLEIQKQIYDLEKQLALDAQYTIAGGWALMFENIKQYQFNFADTFIETFNGIKSSVEAGYQHLFSNVGKGFSTFGEAVKKVANGIKDSFVNMLAKMATEWTLSHIKMTAATSLWKKNEIAMNAGVAASKAAAATAWSLWGALAIGAAIGAGVIAMASKFATGGIVPGNNYSGDNVLAAVNSGEMILNRSQQARLFDIANGNASSGNINLSVNITGNTISDKISLRDISEQVSNDIMSTLRTLRNI